MEILKENREAWQTSHFLASEIPPSTLQVAGYWTCLGHSSYSDRKRQRYMVQCDTRKWVKITHCASSLSFGACLQLLPSLPELKGTSTPMANIIALRSASSAGQLTKALMPAYCSWMKYLEGASVRKQAVDTHHRYDR